MDTQNKYRRIVIKVGSNVLTRDDGRPDTTRAWKKAYVTLTADSKTIEFFEGMV